MQGYIAPRGVREGSLAAFSLEVATAQYNREGGQPGLMGRESAQGRGELRARAAQQTAHDHHRSGSDGGAGVWDRGSVGNVHDHIVEVDPAGISHDLSEDSLGTLAKVGRRRENLDLEIGPQSYGAFRHHASLAVAGEAGPVPEKGQADSLKRPAIVFSSAARESVCRVTFGEARGRLRLLKNGNRTDAFLEHLARWCDTAFAVGIPETHRVRIEAEGQGDLVHLAFHREETLRGAETAEGPIGRRVRGEDTSSNAYVGT